MLHWKGSLARGFTLCNNNIPHKKQTYSVKSSFAKIANFTCYSSKKSFLPKISRAHAFRNNFMSEGMLVSSGVSNSSIGPQA